MTNKNLKIHNFLSENDSVMTSFFDGCHNSELEKNIGKQVVFINPTCIVEKKVHTIVALQRNYKFEICYRVHQSDIIDEDYGRVASIDEVRILELN